MLQKLPAPDADTASDVQHGHGSQRIEEDRHNDGRRLLMFVPIGRVSAVTVFARTLLRLWLHYFVLFNACRVATKFTSAPAAFRSFPHMRLA